MVSFEAAYEQEFGQEHDDLKLVGQDNIRRYLPVGSLRVRVHPDDSAFEIFARVCAARVVGCRTTVSIHPDQSPPMVELLDGLTKRGSVVGVDLVEVAPDYDPTGSTTTLAAQILLNLIGRIAANR